MSSKGIKICAVSIALLLSSSFVAFFYKRSEVAMEISFLAMAFSLLVCFISGGVNFSTGLSSYFFSMVYLIPLCVSHFINISSSVKEFYNFVVLCNLFFAFFMASMFSSRHDIMMAKIVMRPLLIISAPIFLFVILTQQHAYMWGRWEPFNVQPNWWGMMALGLAWCALAWDRMWIRLLGLGIALFFMVKVQSRGSIVALLPAIFYSSGWFYPFTKKRFIKFVVVCAGGGVLLLIGELLGVVALFSNSYNFIVDNILLLNDPRRGIASGMSGRVSGYIMAWNGFVNSPMFGVGPGRYSFVHNGFLLTLAESGVFTFMGMCFVIFSGLKGAYSAKNYEYVGYILSYTAALMTFPRTFNINMTAFLFLLVVFQYIPPKSTA